MTRSCGCFNQQGGLRAVVGRWQRSCRRVDSKFIVAVLSFRPFPWSSSCLYMFRHVSNLTGYVCFWLSLWWFPPRVPLKSGSDKLKYQKIDKIDIIHLTQQKKPTPWRCRKKTSSRGGLLFHYTPSVVPYEQARLFRLVKVIKGHDPSYIILFPVRRGAQFSVLPLLVLKKLMIV
jgi:hypothetical protein